MAVLWRKRFQGLLKKLSLKNNAHDHHVIKYRYDKLGCEDQIEKRSWPPRGYVHIYVGEDHAVYQVPTLALNSPALAALLNEYFDGDDMGGPLSVPCSAEAFKDVLRRAVSQMHA